MWIVKIVLISVMVGLLIVPTIASPDWLMGQDVRTTLRDIHHLMVLILFLVFAAFCNSVKARFWAGLSVPMLAGAVAAVVGIFVLAMVGVAVAARVLGLDRGDRIAAMFCAPQKTIASGIPLAKALFGAHPGLGLIVLPVLLYHPLQLIVCGILAQRWGKRRGG